MSWLNIPIWTLNRPTSTVPTTAWSDPGRRPGTSEISPKLAVVVLTGPLGTGRVRGRHHDGSSPNSIFTIARSYSAESTVTDDLHETNGYHANGTGNGAQVLHHEAFHIGRLAVSDESASRGRGLARPGGRAVLPATGRETMGLARRRHFSVRGRELIGIEDELFGEGHLGIGDDDGLSLTGYSTLIAALETGRTGQLGDIVATIQGEQDEIIRSPHAGVLVVQGGPGTGKTVVALHRPAYLLYTHRFPLEDQGVLVIGPNRLFLRYIERVLPSLGEAGVEQVVLSDLVADVNFGAIESRSVATVKGDVRMSKVLARAVHDRQRALRNDLVIPFGTSSLRLTVGQSEQIIQSARRRFRRHNPGRKFVEQEVFAALARSSRVGELDPVVVRDRTRHFDDVRFALERMWPVLTPAQLLHDLFGSVPLLKLAAGKWLSESEYRSLARPRADNLADMVWTSSDTPLLDEARALLGPKSKPKADGLPDDEIRTYGHIVVDEVQDLTPMELRMCERRSLNGSMTIVGDIGQATGPHAPNDWNDVLVHLPDRKAPRVTELTVGYRIPETAMRLAAKVLAEAAPQLTPPVSVRAGEEDPIIRSVDSFDDLAPMVQALVDRVGAGTVGVITPGAYAEAVASALERAGLSVGRAALSGLDTPITVVPVGLVKGLELDGVLVVDPADMVEREPQGLRALYVALHRATRFLAIAHRSALPRALS